MTGLFILASCVLVGAILVSKVWKMVASKGLKISSVDSTLIYYGGELMVGKQLVLKSLPTNNGGSLIVLEYEGGVITTQRCDSFLNKNKVLKIQSIFRDTVNQKVGDYYKQMKAELKGRGKIGNRKGELIRIRKESNEVYSNY